jgi:hypothetical protein
MALSANECDMEIAVQIGYRSSASVKVAGGEERAHEGEGGTEVVAHGTPEQIAPSLKL